MNFQGKLNRIVKKNNSLVCIGLDSDVDKLSQKFRKLKNSQFEFNKWIIDQTNDLVCAYKPNSAFYEGAGIDGGKALKQTCDYIRLVYKNIPIILDAKRADIGSTNSGYVHYAYDFLGADAITLHPYLGQEALTPFLERKEKGCIILCRTSNPGAGELQDLFLKNNIQLECGRTKVVSLYKYIACQVVKKWNKNKNCMLVVGATYPKELAEIRQIVGDMTLLVPGVGIQGGDVKKTIKAGLNSKKAGMIINSSRGIIFVKNPREEAMKLRDEINRYRK